MSPVPHYRRDIDGLRGVAVTFVLLYHAGTPGFSGGFVGVDVFFVISGFLISSIVMPQVVSGEFSLLQFFSRRIARIVPALLVMLVVVLGSGLVVLTLPRARDLAGDVAATALMFSNIRFMSRVAYFSPDASELPLLHTWSLGVEEQLYLFVPLLLMVAWRFRQDVRFVYPMLIAISYAACVVLLRSHPGVAFYMMPSRAWEFLVGAALYAWQPGPKSPRAQALLATIGFAAIALCVALYDDATPFPGLAAIPTVLGTAMIVSAGMRPQGGRGSALTVRPAVFVGKISYSLYLWHLPMLAFLRNASLHRPSAWAVAVALAVSGVLATASWLWVERPFRSRFSRTGHPGRVIAVAVVLSLGLAGVATAFKNADDPFWPRHASWEPALSRELNDWYKDHCLSDQGITSSPKCHLGGGGASAPDGDKPDFIVWGDSHVEAMAPAFDAAARQVGRSGLLVGAWNCPPSLDLSTTKNPSCRNANRKLAETVLSMATVTDVIIGAYWAGDVTGRLLEGEAYTELADVGRGHNADVLRRGLTQLVDRLTSAGKRVWLIGPVPEQLAHIPKALHLRDVGVLDRIETRVVNDADWIREREATSFLTQVAAATGARLVEPAAILCQGGPCLFEDGGAPLYRDEAHLTTLGASKLIGLARRTLQEGSRGAPAQR